MLIFHIAGVLKSSNESLSSVDDEPQGPNLSRKGLCE